MSDPSAAHDEAGHLLRGSCTCGRNRYAVLIPDAADDDVTGGPAQQKPNKRLLQSRIIFRDKGVGSRHQPSAHHLTPHLRTPLTHYMSTTHSYYPDETPLLIRRIYIPPTDPRTKRGFCGYCGGGLTVWTEGHRSGETGEEVGGDGEEEDEEEVIDVNLEGLSREGWGTLEDLGLLGESSDDEEEEEEEEEEEGEEEAEGPRNASQIPPRNRQPPTITSSSALTTQPSRFPTPLLQAILLHRSPFHHFDHHLSPAPTNPITTPTFTSTKTTTTTTTLRSRTGNTTIEWEFTEWDDDDDHDDDNDDDDDEEEGTHRREIVVLRPSQHVVGVRSAVLRSKSGSKDGNGDGNGKRKIGEVDVEETPGRRGRSDGDIVMQGLN